MKSPRQIVDLWQMPHGRARVPTFIAWAIGIACVAAVAQRFRYATDLTDETFSIALPYRFVLGDKPFVDEISIQQTAGIVLFPFVWAYVKVTGGTTGIVLFVRAVHLFFFKGVAAISVYCASSRLLKLRSSAIAVSFVPFAFVPHSIPNVGYNVIGMTLLTVGTFLTAAGASEPSDKVRMRLLALAGLAYAVMAFAYPPMGVAPILATPLLFICASKRRFASVVAFVAGAAVASLALAPSLAFGGVAGVRRSVGWGVHANVVPSSTRLMQVLVGLWNGMPTFFPIAVAAVVVAWLLRSRVLIAIVVPAITLACAYWFRNESGSQAGAIRTVTYVGAFAPALLLLCRASGPLWRGAVLIVLPGFASAVAAAFVSTQRLDAAALGLYTCTAFFALLAACALERVDAGPAYCILPAAVLMLTLVTRAYDFVYRDSPLPSLTAQVKSGPFKGIWTSPNRVQMSSELEEIVRRYDREDGRILFLYESPGLYLFSRMRPSAHSVWQEFYGDQDGLLAYWRQSYAKGHGIVVRIKGTPQAKIDSIVAPPERRIDETPHFIVYRDGG